MVDLKTQYHQLQHEIDKAVLEALESCQFILGPNVTGLEKETAAYLGSRYAVSCASGTDALHLAVLAAGVGAGDEVITTPLPYRHCRSDLLCRSNAGICGYRSPNLQHRSGID